VKRALVTAGSRGIGKGIADSLSSIGCKVTATSSEQLNTSDLDQIESFISKQDPIDVLVLNTGGPPSQPFEKITKEDCDKYHNQLFYGFLKIIQETKINDNGYIFLITSYNIKEPDPKLMLSNAYRIAFVSVFKCLSKILGERGITCINIAPGPIQTDRLTELCKDISGLEERIPVKRVGTTKEIGDFVSSIVEKEINYLTGVTINFDGGKSNYVL
jgi:3-oxoacyl-[acyl-carrier protein] reductase